MIEFRCKSCGGAVAVNEHSTIYECEYCGCTMTLPKLEDERRLKLYDRAGHFRRKNEFDKAMGVYESILNEDTTDPEAYWSIVLCRYGVEYVEDPITKNRIPTCHRTQISSIYADEDYKAALQYANGESKEIYEKEANAIEEIQHKIIEISSHEEPFDVFICYKESDEKGQRTEESLLAEELYGYLTEANYKVFFSRITLEDKLGVAYEPYIFAALNSAPIMLVITTNNQNVNAVWVKNEWSRYLSFIKAGKKKTLIPIYKNMDPYDLPDEFSHLQAQDASKIGFKQDLLRGIKKILPKEIEDHNNKQVHSPNAATVESLLKRISIFLENKQFESAYEYCDRVLDINPEEAKAYLSKLMAELHISKEESLYSITQDLSICINYINAYKYANTAMKNRLLMYEKENKLRCASQAMKRCATEADYVTLQNTFEKLGDYKNANELMLECKMHALECRKNDIRAKIEQLKTVLSNIEKEIQQAPDELKKAMQQEQRNLKNKRAARNSSLEYARVLGGILLFTSYITIPWLINLVMALIRPLFQSDVALYGLYVSIDDLAQEIITAFVNVQQYAKVLGSIVCVYGVIKLVMSLSRWNIKRTEYKLAVEEHKNFKDRHKEYLTQLEQKKAQVIQTIQDLERDGSPGCE